MKELPISSGLMGIMGSPAKAWVRLFANQAFIARRDGFTLDYKVEIKLFNPRIPGMFEWTGAFIWPWGDQQP